MKKPFSSLISLTFVPGIFSTGQANGQHVSQYIQIEYNFNPY